MAEAVLEISASQFKARCLALLKELEARHEGLGHHPARG
jgi:hypothetical protein